MASVLAAIGCAPKQDLPVTRYTSLEKLSPRQFPVFEDTLDNTEGLVRAIDQSLLYFSRVPGDRVFYFSSDGFSADHLRHSLEVFRDFMTTAPGPGEMDGFIREHFLVYRSNGSIVADNDRVLFTGYYEPTVEGSLTRGGGYMYPLYPEPSDMVYVDLSAFSDKYDKEPRLTARVNEHHQVVPYFSRQEINQHPDFEAVAAPIAWLNNRTDRFFLEIQGSGRVVLRDGSCIRVHYHGKNGHPYRSVGRYLIEKGEIEKEAMSMQAIRTWLEQNPDRAEEVFHYNPSFVFFKLEDGGPYGSLGVEVTPLRSIATDRSLFPKGALCFIQTSLPSREGMETPDAWKQVAGFVLNQDTGGAIKGASRVDLFCGNGAYAEYAAGHLNQPGNLYFLVLKQPFSN